MLIDKNIIHLLIGYIDEFEFDLNIIKFDLNIKTC